MRPRFLALPLLLAGPTVASEARWDRTLDEVAKAVVAIQIDQTRAFDGNQASSSQATGFIVDAERGIILTNRHVVSPGPVVAQAVLDNHEEIELTAVYRDPVHDFGFFRYDPAAIRHMQVHALKLDPGRARIGTEIRVLGNDAGEKLSILSGTLARLDRAAPRYGNYTYNDFNTFYIQAASSTSGGSSGSPVVDVAGRVVALNAGGANRAASSFYLPLERVVRALQRVQAGEPVPRGTIETVFRRQTYDELRRLGLSAAAEAKARKRHPDALGLLVVEEIVPGGPADGKLRLGDVLVSVNGEPVATFIELEGVLDDSVGKPVKLRVERGGTSTKVTLSVADLHAITPHEYLEYGGGVLHELSYQMARNHHLPVDGVFVARAGQLMRRAGLVSQTIITEINGVPVHTVADAEAQLVKVAEGETVIFRFFHPVRPKVQAVGTSRLSRRWHPMQRCTRNDQSGLWDCDASPPAPPPPAHEPATSAFPREKHWIQRKVSRSLVTVQFHAPYRVDGLPDNHYIGAGVILDAERGLVLTERSTVPTPAGDVFITVAGSEEIPGKVELVHPFYNVVLVSFDPRRLGETPIRAIQLRDRPLEKDDHVWLFGLDAKRRFTSARTSVRRIQALRLGDPGVPRFRGHNVEVAELKDAVPTVGGLVTDRWGRMTALWAGYQYDGPKGQLEHKLYALPTEYILDALEDWKRGSAAGLGFELLYLPLSEARELGLPARIAHQIEREKERRALLVYRTTADAPAAGQLLSGDLILEVDGETATSFRQVERAIRRGPVHLTILRNREEKTVTIAALTESVLGAGRYLVWAGLLLQKPHLEVASQRGQTRHGLYISYWWYGSPGRRGQLSPSVRLVAAEGRPVDSFDDLMAAVGDKADRAPVRVTVVDLEGKPSVHTLKLDLHYWPTFELQRTDSVWSRVPVTPDGRARSSDSIR